MPQSQYSNTTNTDGHASSDAVETLETIPKTVDDAQDHTEPQSNRTTSSRTTSRSMSESMSDDDGGVVQALDTHSSTTTIQEAVKNYLVSQAKIDLCEELNKQNYAANNAVLKTLEKQITMLIRNNFDAAFLATNTDATVTGGVQILTNAIIQASFNSSLRNTSATTLQNDTTLQNEMEKIVSSLTQSFIQEYNERTVKDIRELYKHLTTATNLINGQTRLAQAIKMMSLQEFQSWLQQEINMHKHALEDLQNGKFDQQLALIQTRCQQLGRNEGERNIWAQIMILINQIISQGQQIISQGQAEEGTAWMHWHTQLQTVQAAVDSRLKELGNNEEGNNARKVIVYSPNHLPHHTVLLNSTPKDVAQAHQELYASYESYESQSSEEPYATASRDFTHQHVAVDLAVQGALLTISSFQVKNEKHSLSMTTHRLSENNTAWHINAVDNDSRYAKPGFFSNFTKTPLKRYASTPECVTTSAKIILSQTNEQDFLMINTNKPGSGVSAAASLVGVVVSGIESLLKKLLLLILLSI